jgi:transcriptional regulator with XRE-family HTH domain
MKTTFETESMTMSMFAVRLRLLRQERCISQQRLADEIGTSKSSVNMYERGEREPGIETVTKIAEYFNVDVDYLFGTSDIRRRREQMKIGEKIRLRRMEQGMSMQDLADRMGYANKSTVARIESGEIDPPQSKVVKFADALGTSVSDLMGWLDEENEKPAVQGELSDKVKQLVDFALSVPEDKIDLVLKVMKSIVEDD